MLNLDVRVLDTTEKDVKVTYVMREICGPHDEAEYMKFEAHYATGFTVEELIASCAVDGGVAFYLNHCKLSELVSIIIEEDE